MSKNFAEKYLIYIVSILVLAFDGAYFDIFPLIIPYMALEYLKFTKIADSLRVLVILIIHSSLCFQRINFIYVLIFATYISFIIMREYFLKPFLPFLIYIFSIGLLTIVADSCWITSLILTTSSLFLWRSKLEKA